MFDYLMLNFPNTEVDHWMNYQKVGYHYNMLLIVQLKQEQFVN